MPRTQEREPGPGGAHRGRARHLRAAPVEGVRAEGGERAGVTGARRAAPQGAEGADRLRRRRLRPQLRRRPRRGLRRHGAVRLRQVHAGPVPDPADRAHGGRGRLPGRGHPALQREVAARAAPAQDLDGVPALRAAAAPPGHRQRRLRPGDPRRRQGRADEARRRGDRAGGALRLRELLPRPALRRHAAAGRAGPCARGQPGRPALRRAVLRAGPADPPGHAERGHPAAPRGRQDHGLHHPRPVRGAQAG